jgi:hypothetical protein
VSVTNDLQHSPAQITTRVLVDLGVATEAGGVWPVYYSSEPDRPDSVITVYDTAGTDEGSIHTGEAQGHYGIQVRVRGINHAAVWARANLIARALQTQYHTRVTLDDDEYLVQCYARFSGPIPLGRVGGSTRTAFTLNLLVTIVNSPATVVPGETIYLVDQSGNHLVDSAGNSLLGAA